jgi:hypothetical protein
MLSVDAGVCIVMTLQPMLLNPRRSGPRRHWPPIANQAPHRHRQANSGTCRGREPPHARHTFEVLPPETRPNKLDLSGRKSWSESDDPAFAAKAADIVRLYMAWPWARLHGGDDQVLGRRRHLVSSSKSKRGPPGRGVVTMPRKGFGEFRPPRPVLSRAITWHTQTLRRSENKARQR